MESELITLNKSELNNLVRIIVKEEIKKINEVSQDEQIELENLYGSKLNSKNYNKNDCVRL